MSTIGTMLSQMKLATLIGGESKRFEALRSVAGFTQVVADPILTLPEGQAVGSPTTLWDSGQTGLGGTIPEQFTYGMVIADPDTENASTLGIDIEITERVGGGSIVRCVRISRDRPLILQSMGGALLTIISGAAPSQVVLIRARNPNAVGSPVGTNNVKVRCLLMK